MSKLVPEKFGSLSRLLDMQLSLFPQHERFLSSRFADVDEDHLAFTDKIAELVTRIAGSSLDVICEDYRWLAHIVFEEEIFFRRHGRYRLSKFTDAVEQVYSNAPYMHRYMNGLLATQIWWRNHTDVLRVFSDAYLPGNRPGFSHLEIGPGHGLFLHLAASSPLCAQAEGWDISVSSIDATRAALSCMGTPSDVSLQLCDLFEEHDRSFDSIVCSEVLEHLEQPADALARMRRLLAPGGRVFVNAPVNSPAPDHIYLFKTPEALVEMVRDADFDILTTHLAPATGATLERARAKMLTISTVVVASLPQN